MADTHALPAPLEPDPHEHGLASRDVTVLAATIDRAWELFEDAARRADLSMPSRRPGWNGRAVVAQVGEWEFGRSLADLLADAHDGDAGTIESHAFDARILVTAQTADDATVLAAASAARTAAATWLASDGPATWGLVHTSSPLGPLPVLTVLSAGTYQLAVAALDLEPCGAPLPAELVRIGLAAVIDITGALAARNRFTGSFTAVTPGYVVGVGARAGHWRTAELDSDPGGGPTVHAEARTVLHVTSGRAPVAHYYRTGALRVSDLPGLLRLAPVLDGVPGVPPLGAIGRALQVVDAVGGLLGRLRP